VVKVKDPKRQYLTLEDFLRLPANFYRSLGVDPFETNKNTSIALHLVFVAQLVGLSLAMSMQLELVWINEDFFQSMQVLGYSTFGIAGMLKAVTVQLRKDKMISLVRQLRSCFPSPTEDEQKQYEVKFYLQRFNRFAKGFGGLYMALVITYDLAAIGQYAFQRWVLRLSNPTQSLPYTSPLPWEWRGSWRYYPTYLMQSINGYTATGYHISADIMIFAVVMQVIMHFDRLAKALREFKFSKNAKEGNEDQDLNNLRTLIAYHNQVLDLTDVMNEIFGIPLLLNFLASSLLVCNVGFQLTLGFSSEHIGQQLMLLTSALVEIYLICFFSQMLIDASEYVSFAAYEMNWTEADCRFRKMMVLLCLRAQKPVCLKATVFVDISIGTMSIFLRVSYKFFCAIRSMYQ
ncbi:hypothetical protein KR038_011955, partial [Drosophila bunnanda]